MGKEVTMTFRVELDLRSNFTEAAGLEHRPAAQVLRDFMREYVKQARGSQPALTPPISTDERKRREKAVSFARASIGLEGFKVSKKDEIHAQRFINGEIELADFVKGPNEQARER